MISTYLVWFIVGLVFIILEVTMPNFVFIFFGLGAWAAALAAFLTSWGLEYQVTLFVVVSVLGLVALRRLGLKVFTGRAEDTVDDGLDVSPVGARCLVSREIGPTTSGTVKFRGTFWRAVSEETLPAGTQVLVERVETSQDGTIYHVRRVEHP